MTVSRAAQPVVAPDPGAVLSRAVLRAAEELDLPGRVLAQVLGISEATASRLARGRGIAPESKEGELALLLLRLYRSLDALVGGDRQASRAWLHGQNLHLGDAPIRLIVSVEGLLRTTEYLDALRGRL